MDNAAYSASPFFGKQQKYLFSGPERHQKNLHSPLDTLLIGGGYNETVSRTISGPVAQLDRALVY
jgi:hypothetical protein